MVDEPGELAVVVRYTRYEGASPEQCVALMSLHDDLVEADSEAMRLNLVRPNERVEYFVKIVRIRSA